MMLVYDEGTPYTWYGPLYGRIVSNQLTTVADRATRYLDKEWFELQVNERAHLTGLFLVREGELEWD